MINSARKLMINDNQIFYTVCYVFAVSTTNPLLMCDFEDPNLCGWSHDPTHDFDWKRNQFATPSGHVGTGPTFDHTFGTGKGGNSPLFVLKLRE